jgi:hypothetical protein
MCHPFFQTSSPGRWTRISQIRTPHLNRNSTVSRNLFCGVLCPGDLPISLPALRRSTGLGSSHRLSIAPFLLNVLPQVAQRYEPCTRSVFPRPSFDFPLAVSTGWTFLHASVSPKKPMRRLENRKSRKPSQSGSFGRIISSFVVSPRNPSCDP